MRGDHPVKAMGVIQRQTYFWCPSCPQGTKPQCFGSLSLDFNTVSQAPHGIPCVLEFPQGLGALRSQWGEASLVFGFGEPGGF